MEKKFVKGAFTSRKDTAPAWVKADISFNEAFIDFYNDNKNEKGYLNTTLKESGSTGKLYLDLKETEETGDQEKLVKEGFNVKVEPRDDVDFGEPDFVPSHPF